MVCSFMIRKMQFKDIEAIKEIDRICFKADSSRTSEGIQGYIEAGFNSSLVYEADGKVVGFNFIHPWGSFGWFGPFGVHPDYQGKGIGKALIIHTIRTLKEDFKVSSIGLNTMPESQYNVGFYMGLGFAPLRLSLSLERQLPSPVTPRTSNDFTVNEIDISNETNYLFLKDTLKHMSSKIIDNLDLTPELYLVRNEDFGTVFTLEALGKICGIAICHTKSIREASFKTLEIKLAVIDSSIDYKEALDSILTACTNYAKSINYERISISCNTYNTAICNYLMHKQGFKIQKTQVMLLMGENNPFKSDKILLLCRLAG